MKKRREKKCTDIASDTNSLVGLVVIQYGGDIFLLQILITFFFSFLSVLINNKALIDFEKFLPKSKDGCMTFRKEDYISSITWMEPRSLPVPAG